VALSQDDDKRFTALFSDGQSVTARSVIVATGGFQSPIVPEESAGFSAEVRQLTTASYRSSQDLPDGTVLIVGDGASGRDIAVGLADTHETIIATGRKRRLLPERIFGIGIWRWLRGLGLLSAGTHSVIGRFMRKTDPFPNRQRHLDDLRTKGIDIMPRFLRAEGRTAHFQDGSSRQVDAVIWSLGYRDDLGWLKLRGALYEAGAPLHSEGRSPVPGLWYVGRPWQRNRASGLIVGAGDDAALIVQQILAEMDN
jgi:putative flavoprotein involved in K+ transport